MLVYLEQLVVMNAVNAHAWCICFNIFCFTKFITHKTFYITAISESEPELFTESPEPSQLMIYADQLECKWEKLGQALRLPTDCLNSMSTMPDGTKFYSRVIETWAEKKTTPYTWDTLLYALKAIGEDKIADEILGIIYIYVFDVVNLINRKISFIS